MALKTFEMTADDFINQLSVKNDKEEIRSITQQNLLADTLAPFEEQEDRFMQVAKQLVEVPDQDVFDRKLVKDNQEELNAQNHGGDFKEFDLMTRQEQLMEKTQTLKRRERLVSFSKELKQDAEKEEKGQVFIKCAAIKK